MKKNFLLLSSLLLIFAGMLNKSFSQLKLDYQEPPKEIKELVDVTPTPAVSVDSKGGWMLLQGRPNFPPIEEVARPELRLAGIRINPANNGQSRDYFYNNLSLKNIKSGEEFKIDGLPQSPSISDISWSPDEKKIAFILSKREINELWLLTIEDKKAKKLVDIAVNCAMPGNPFDWLSNSEALIFRAIPETRGNPPQKDLVPSGPVISQNLGKKAPARTYQDLLQNQHDENLFEYYSTSQLYKVSINGQVQKFGRPAIYRSVEESPDGNYLLISYIKRPFSYLVPYYRFPYAVEIWNQQAELVHTVADIPLVEEMPQGFDATRTGPRNFMWRNDVPATLYWVKALDGGDPRKEVNFRDRLFYLKAPFDGKPQKCFDLKLRLYDIDWKDNDLAIVTEFWWKTRKVITSSFAPDKPQKGKREIFDRSYEDRYNDPGYFVTTRNQQGKEVLLTADNGKTLFLFGQGASPEGNMPFIDKMNIKTLEKERLWQCEAPYYESARDIIDTKKMIVLTRRESVDKPANYYLRNLKTEELTALTEFPNPYPQLKGMTKEMIKFEREDGVPLSGTLYLPPNHDKSQPLPVLMWAYPREYKSADAAGQVSGSPYTFTRIHWASPVPYLTQGFAVFDRVSMPVIGEGDKEPNDSFRKQLVANAKAAIDILEEMNVGDPERIAIGGHSYGAFMTANLLAHSDLFAAGIARSGAYNRTLTPFGFQAEERTYWQAPDVYYNMSPFMHADKIEEPILLIHGQADNNSGTYPMQSERFYNALKGHGAVARLVMLPHESHGYRAHESIMHVLWEQHQWLEKYVKNNSVQK